MEETEPQTQPPSSTHARKSTDSSSSPEFEFWMVRNPSFPQPNILSADQLFVNGVLLPLHLLPQQTEPERDPKPELKLEPETLPESTVGSSASKRWKDIFKIGDRRASTASSRSGNEETTAAAECKDKEKRKKEKKSSGLGCSSSISNPTADLNINIWPFSRSRSAGNWSSGGRAKASAAGARKASSAPCSRSNSGGESKLKKWPSSPGRAGVHLGRSSPVWQVRRGGSGGKGSEPVVRRSEKGVSKEGLGNRRSGVGDRSNGGARVLNLTVPLCIGYRQHLSCSSDDSGFGNPNNHSGNGNPGNHSSGNATLFNLRTLFSKKVH
ncbi:uncharacterized protein LOC131229391 [Magnolia sinica]|uniref:uncharacterized protein LOC131229391 n=1 Tax=Magnolia sinica TaxID=86752 RepID=UPI00265835A3|nr:uncharacterized protein LOC131229391 [Magnolia sinica]